MVLIVSGEVFTQWLRTARLLMTRLSAVGSLLPVATDGFMVPHHAYYTVLFIELLLLVGCKRGVGDAVGWTGRRW
jgi:hypothetical protein